MLGIEYALWGLLNPRTWEARLLEVGGGFVIDDKYAHSLLQ